MEKNTSTIVNLAKETYESTFADGSTYRLPENIIARNGNRKTDVRSLVVESGSELATQLDVDASLSGSYAGFSASASGHYSYGSSMNSNSHYAILSVNHTSFNLNLKGHKELDSRIDEEFLDNVRKLPEWKVDDNVYKQYIWFFNSWGTHFVKSCTFGARYQLKLENREAESQSKQEFEVNVSAEYSGVGSVKGDLSVKNSEKYKRYLRTRQFQTKVYGGSSSSNLILGNAPDDPEKYQEAFKDWAESLNNAFANNLIHVQIDSIGNMLMDSSKQEHNDLGQKLVDALDYLATMRLAEGDLRFAIPFKPDPAAYTREVVIQKAPGLQISHVIHGRPPVLRIDADLTNRNEGGTSFRGFSHRPMKVSFANSAANVLTADVHYSKSSIIDLLNPSEFEIQVNSIEGIIPISILSPPTPVVVKVSSPRPPLSNTDFDLSPTGPKLHLPESKNEMTFEVQSLFRPGFGGDGILLGSCVPGNLVNH